MTIPLAPVLGVIAMPSLQNAAVAALNGNAEEALNQAAGILGMYRGSFSVDRLLDNMRPLFLGIVIHIMASKLGVNRVLGRAKVPFIRI